MTKTILSKSKYLAGLQCPKLLWFHYNAKQEIPEYDGQTQAIFNQGHEVGELAKKLFPDGINVDWDVSFQDALDQSQRLLTQRKPLFEAGFMFGGAYARVDVLAPVDGGKWDIIEVKSGTAVKPVNLHDVAFQRYCCEGAGVPIRGCFLMHINNQYVRNGEIEPESLFTKVDVTDKTDEARANIPKRIQDMQATINLKKCPDVDIGPHCRAPYDCPLIEKCWSRVNEADNNISTLFKLRAETRWLRAKPDLGRRDGMTDKQTRQELPANVGKTVNIGFPDGSTMQWEVVDEIRKNEDEDKIFVLQRLRQKSDGKQEMFRFGYYIIGKKPQMKDKWTWGQYAPFVTAEDFSAIISEAQRRGWLKTYNVRQHK